MFFPDNHKFPKLNFPVYLLKIKQNSKNALIWDSLRQLWLCLTPEEWVRQHVIQFLHQELSQPLELIKAEHPAKVGTQTTQRIDLLCYNSRLKATLLVECKAPSVNISSQVLDQAIRYNSDVEAQFIMLTNGLTHFFYEKLPSGEYVAMGRVPKINL